jgi:peroxiredoxin
MNRHGDRVRIAIFMSLILVFCSVCAPFDAGCSGLPQKDTVLPSFQLPAPVSEDDQKYLGISGQTLHLKDVQCQLLLVEILGAYCPLCYQQAPLFSKLYARLAKRNLGDRVKMLGIAIGATPMEVDQLRKNGSYQFPIVPDQSFAVHKLLGEPRTPFTMLIGKQGKVLYAHLGVIEDVDAFYQVIQDLVK